MMVRVQLGLDEPIEFNRHLLSPKVRIVEFLGIIGEVDSAGVLSKFIENPDFQLLLGAGG